MRGTRLETAKRAPRETGNFAECLLANRVVALLEHEGLDVAQSELTGCGAKIVERFFHGIADEDQGSNFPAVVFAACVIEDFADLGMAAAAIDARHQRAEPRRLGHPW